MTEELSAIAGDMLRLLPLFEEGNSVTGMFLPAEHAAAFKALAIEAKSIIDEELGLANDYSIDLLRTVNNGTGGRWLR